LGEFSLWHWYSIDAPVGAHCKMTTRVWPFNYPGKAYNQPFAMVGTYWLEMRDGCCTGKTV
jgi:hypothetical protein